MKKINREYPCLKGLTFSKDLTLPNNLGNSDMPPSPILTFHSSNHVSKQASEVSDDKSKDIIQNFRQALNKTLDAFSRNGIATDLSQTLPKEVSCVSQHDKQTQWDENIGDILDVGTSQNLAMFYSELPDSNMQLFEYREEFQPSFMSRLELDLQMQRIQVEHQRLDSYELTSNDIQLFVEDDVQKSNKNLNTVEDDSENTEVSNVEKPKSKVEFNYLLTLLDKILHTNDPVPRCTNCSDCISCKDLSVTCSTNI